MITRKESYRAKTAYLFLGEKTSQIAAIHKKIAKLGLDANEGVFSHRKVTGKNRRKKTLIIKWLINAGQNLRQHQNNDGKSTNID